MQILRTQIMDDELEGNDRRHIWGDQNSFMQFMDKHKNKIMESFQVNKREFRTILTIHIKATNKKTRTTP